MKHTITLPIFLLALSCGEESTSDIPEASKTNTTTVATPTAKNGGQKGVNNRPIPPTPNDVNAKNQQAPQNGLLLGSSPTEDLTSSWTPALSVDATIQQKNKPSSCPDDDGDGFVSAELCGDWIETIQADCNDQDASVTPDTERYVPSGRFIMGSTSTHAGADESPVHIVELSGYCVDVDEVSVASFTSWLTKTNRSPEGKDIRSIVVEKDGLTIEDGRAEHPAEGATWTEAKDFCAAQGKALPTEAQWEKSARGGCELGTDPTKCDPEDLRAYPWGSDTPSCELANHQLSTSGLPTLCVSNTVLPSELSTGTGPYGHHHLAGNVWEYVADVWHPSVYTKELRTNPAGPKSGDFHVLRGGGWNTFSTNMRVANRFHDLVMGSASGFRCARSFVPQQFDDVEPLIFSTLEGTISSTRPLKGRALYVTAFDAKDADSRGMLFPGRSPIAEMRLTPNNETSQPFSLNLPLGSYIISAALDAGTGANKDDYVSASGSGGFGHAKENPITVQSPVKDIQIELRSAPMMKAPNKPPQSGQQPNVPPQQPSQPSQPSQQPPVKRQSK